MSNFVAAILAMYSALLLITSLYNGVLLMNTGFCFRQNEDFVITKQLFTSIQNITFNDNITETRTIQSQPFCGSSPLGLPNYFELVRPSGKWNEMINRTQYSLDCWCVETVYEIVLHWLVVDEWDFPLLYYDPKQPPATANEPTLTCQYQAVKMKCDFNNQEKNVVASVLASVLLFIVSMIIVLQLPGGLHFMYAVHCLIQLLAGSSASQLFFGYLNKIGLFKFGNMATLMPKKLGDASGHPPITVLREAARGAEQADEVVPQQEIRVIKLFHATGWLIARMDVNGEDVFTFKDVDNSSSEECRREHNDRKFEHTCNVLKQMLNNDKAVVKESRSALFGISFSGMSMTEIIEVVYGRDGFVSGVEKSMTKIL